MEKQLTQTEMVFSALKELGTGSYTTRDIMSAMTNDELERLKHDSKTVSKLLQKLEKSGRIKQAEKVRMGSVTVSKWQLVTSEEIEVNEVFSAEIEKHKVSTDKPVVSAAPEAVESKTVEETVKGYPTEAEQEYFDGFSHPKDLGYSIKPLIWNAQNTALFSIASVFSGLIEVVEKSDYSKKEIEYLDDKLTMLNDLSRVFAGSPYAQLLEEIKGDLQ
jgi:hypothetical protein